MEEQRASARNTLGDFVSAWLSGDYGALGEVCAPAVQWWSPLDDETAEGLVATCGQLERVLAAVPPPIEVTALLVSEDGSRGVVEMRAAPASREAAPALVTSVVTLSAGRVTEGRTYTALLTDDPRNVR